MITARPAREDTGNDQIVVDPLGWAVQSRIQQFVRRKLVRQHDGRIPMRADRLQYGGATARLIDGQIE